MTFHAPIERQFQPIMRRDFRMWTDASGLKGLGGYFQEDERAGIHDIQPRAAFMLVLPRHIKRKQEHINSKEMRAVEQGLLRWGGLWKGSRPTLYIDNQAVVHGIKNQTVQGGAVGVLHGCLLLASMYDLELNPCWIPTGNNTLADALSRFDRRTVANIAPQLLSLFVHQKAGYLTFEVQA